MRVIGWRGTTYVNNVLAERRLRDLHVNHGVVAGVRGPNVTVGCTTADTRVSQIVQVLSTHNLSCQASQHQTFRQSDILEEY